MLWIGPYLRDELSDVEKEEFEEVVKTHISVKKELELQRKIQNAVNKTDEFKKFKDSLNAAQSDFFRKHKKKVIELITFRLFAA